MLEALRADQSTEFGAPGARVEVLRRIDGPYSTVQRVRIQTPTRTSHAFVKVLRPRGSGPEGAAMADRMLKREYLATLSVYEALRDDPLMGAVRPLAWLPEHRALVTEEVPGRPFGDLLAEGDQPADALEAVASRVGAWIRRYQTIGSATGVIELSERRRYLETRLQPLEGRVLSSDDRQGALRLFDSLADAIGSPTVPAVAIHADLTPYNVLVDQNGRMTVLDFTMVKSGASYHDLTHMYFHLELLSARQRARRAALRGIQRALVAGYAPTLSPADPLFRLLLLQHGVCHVALMAERRVPVVDAAYRWFMRRRWRLCARLSEGAHEPQIA